MNRFSALAYVALIFCASLLLVCGGEPDAVREIGPAEVVANPTADPGEGAAEPDNQVNYLEFPATDIEETKEFYSEVFGWEFTDYGPGYTSFQEGRLAGGFTVEREVAAGGVLFVLYSADLVEIESRVRESGGQIVQEIFEFPGGRRFHFTDPSGNELAVWSDR